MYISLSIGTRRGPVKLSKGASGSAELPTGARGLVKLCKGANGPAELDFLFENKAFYTVKFCHIDRWIVFLEKNTRPNIHYFSNSSSLTNQ